MKCPYKVAPHLDRFRIVGVSGAPGLRTYTTTEEAERMCAELAVAYAHGARDKSDELRTALHGVVSLLKGES